jgi:hypothetical protein
VFDKKVGGSDLGIGGFFPDAFAGKAVKVVGTAA